MHSDGNSDRTPALRASLPSPLHTSEHVEWLECRLQQLSLIAASDQRMATRAHTTLVSYMERFSEALAELEQMRQQQGQKLPTTSGCAPSKPSAQSCHSGCGEVVRQKSRIALYQQNLDDVRDRLAAVDSARSLLFRTLTEWLESGEKTQEEMDLASFIADFRREIFLLSKQRDTIEQQRDSLIEEIVKRGLDPEELLLQNSNSNEVAPRLSEYTSAQQKEQQQRSMNQEETSRTINLAVEPKVLGKPVVAASKNASARLLQQYRNDLLQDRPDKLLHAARQLIRLDPQTAAKAIRQALAKHWQRADICSQLLRAVLGMRTAEALAIHLYGFSHNDPEVRLAALSGCINLSTLAPRPLAQLVTAALEDDDAQIKRRARLALQSAPGLASLNLAPRNHFSSQKNGL